ncbi:ABC transporter permease [Paenibacillus apis]|uniref:ABC transporter permease n=1 Tax=Paenibacillus apis TaxID=1792174 RepID=UPI00265A755A|nr:ABC transporter permease [Paenibacillus apis]
MIKHAIQDFIKYKDYFTYNVQINLRLKVSNTFLGYFWWLIDPLLHMLVYSFIVEFVFRRGEANFPVFVFCGLLSWKWFSSTMNYSASCIKSNSGVLNQVYVPKFLFPLQETTVNLIKFLFGFIILIAMLFFFKIMPTIHFLGVIPIIISNYLFIFAVSLLLTHFGVFITDLKNFLGHFTRIWWYLSPGMYSLNIIPEKFRWVFWLNPNTAFFESYRNVIMYNESPNYVSLLIWDVISLFLIYVGLRIIYQFDRSYSKII